MRIFALSDLHLDYDENLRWLNQLSELDYRDDTLILAGDISDNPKLLEKGLARLRSCFAEVLYTPGNHDLWVRRNECRDSFAKLKLVKELALEQGVRITSYHRGHLSVIPLLGWYDYSFGVLSNELQACWVDFFACKWPREVGVAQIADFFLAQNDLELPEGQQQPRLVISFSHFVPRIDVMPSFIPADKRALYPVLGSQRLDRQIEKLGSRFHIYGHSHINRQIIKGHTCYINNAFGYPHETRITAKELKCICEVSLTE